MSIPGMRTRRPRWLSPLRCAGVLHDILFRGTTLYIWKVSYTAVMPRPTSAACATGYFPASAGSHQNRLHPIARWHSFRASSCDVETVVLRTMWAAVTFDVHMSHYRQAQECCRYLPEGLTWNSLSTYTCLSKVQHKTTSIMPRQRGRTRTSCMNGRLALANGMRALMKPKREGAWDQDLA